MKYELTVEFTFCYGHRLLNYDGKCRHLHGHNGIVQVTIEGNELDKRGMVMDFGDVKKAMKDWVDANLDHKMILCGKDPALPELQKMGEPIFVIDENPTAEIIAKIIAEAGKKLGFPVCSVTLWETPTSKVVYNTK